MQRLLWILTILLASGAASAADAWSTFHDPDGLFAVELPAAPKVMRRTVAGGDGKPVERAEYSVGDGAVAMIVTVAAFSRVRDPGAVLDAAVKSAAAQASRDLSDTAIALDGHAGRHVAFIDGHGNRFDDRFFLIGERLIQVVAVQTQGADAAAIADIQRFRTSFHFIAK